MIKREFNLRNYRRFIEYFFKILSLEFFFFKWESWGIIFSFLREFIFRDCILNFFLLIEFLFYFYIVFLYIFRYFFKEV